jgi:hypothetical protein
MQIKRRKQKMNFALIVHVASSKGGKYYNNPVNGEPLLFQDEEKAEHFALKVENESSNTVWIEVVNYNPNLKLENLHNEEFVQTIGKHLGKS